MPAGRNGPYDNPETHIRNTGHWISTWSKAYRTVGDEVFRQAGARALAYILSTARDRRPRSNLEFRTAGQDRCNGVIGAAWMIESLTDAYAWLGDASALQLAMDLHEVHPFDSALGLWQSVDSNGDIQSFDATFNHQLWFAAGAARLGEHSGHARSQIEVFLDRLDEPLVLDEDGQVAHRIPKHARRPVGGRRPRSEGFLSPLGLRTARLPFARKRRRQRLRDRNAPVLA